MMNNMGMRLALMGGILVLLSSFALLSLHPVDSDNAVVFTIKNFGINTKGELKGLKGNIEWNEENPTASSIRVSVNTATINTGIDSRDASLKEEDYFNTEQYPVISFESTGITAANGQYTAIGKLTIKGVTKSISFPFTATKATNGYLFAGSLTINRLDFGVGKNSMVLSNDVDISLKVPAVP